MNRFSEDNFEKIVYRYSDMLMRVAFQRMLNFVDAQDVVQDIFTKLYCFGNSFNTEEHLKAWLIRITINRCKEISKLKWKKIQLTTDDFTVSFDQQDFEIIELLESLKPSYRDIIYLYYYEEYKISEIAEMKNKSINTISSQLQRARKKIKKLSRRIQYD